MGFTAVASLCDACRRIQALAGACWERMSLGCAFCRRLCRLRSLGSERGLITGAGHQCGR